MQIISYLVLKISQLQEVQRHKRKTAVNIHSVSHKKLSKHGCNILQRLFQIFKQHTPSLNYRVWQRRVPRYSENKQHFGHRYRFSGSQLTDPTRHVNVWRDLCELGQPQLTEIFISPNNQFVIYCQFYRLFPLATQLTLCQPGASMWLTQTRLSVFKYSEIELRVFWSSMESSGIQFTRPDTTPRDQTVALGLAM